MATAVTPSETTEDAPTIDLLLVEIDNERYALPSSSVQGIVRHHPWTAVPGAPPALPGIISQRGLILPIVEMRVLLDLPEADVQRATRFVFVQHQETDMALLIDRVIDLETVPESLFVQPLDALNTRRERFVRGIAHTQDGPLGLLDLDVVITALREGN